MNVLVGLVGVVTDGYGHASHTLERARPRIAELMGVKALHPGTLNVTLSHPYQMDNTIQLHPSEVNDVDLLVLQRCKIGGYRCALVRPYLNQPHVGWDSNPPTVLELMSEVCLRDALKLATGDAVTVEVEGDDVWWIA